MFIVPMRRLLGRLFTVGLLESGLGLRIRITQKAHFVLVMEYIGPGRIMPADPTIPEARDAGERRAMWVEALRLMAKLHKSRCSVRVIVWAVCFF